MIEFILGGARSGKSKLAEHRAGATGLPVIYIATAQSKDIEMSSRILSHRQSRPASWTTVEEPVELHRVLAQYDDPKTVILVDCLTLWISNLLCLDDGQHFTAYKKAFVQQLKRQSNQVILVSNETGLGVVPMGELSRRFVDESGWLHQEIAELADRVTLAVAGLPHTLK